jgi:tetratricopeptide (TPR) repeat protein
MVKAALKQYEQADQFYQQALKIHKQVGDVYHERDTLNNLGNLYKQWGQQSKAKQYFDQAREITRKLESGKAKKKL